ncbi:unnamed protein product [Caenorhabditis auriculariae]|uniref:Uncharacterized protein n=1 Tax=Caenorhabditis auriculariae TaxID=2777116 RepID=A0A8S1HLP4_9PELO|nr:unnamed protein product [Caenorhabditis auriculariae]
MMELLFAHPCPEFLFEPITLRSRKRKSIPVPSSSSSSSSSSRSHHHHHHHHHHRQAAAVVVAPAGRTNTVVQAAPAAGANLGMYIDKLVETLVVNSTPAVKATQATAPTTKDGDLPLSYTQINALENVCRLLKSQSRPESPMSKFDDDRKPTTPSLPLTRELLIQHTKRWEEECKDTWNRRLKRLSDDLPCSPPPVKQHRPNVCATPPLHWTLAQKQEFYRSLAPNPPPPAGKNYQITYTPLVDDPDLQPPRSDVENQVRPASAFTTVHPKLVPVKELPAPIRLSIAESVIQAPAEPYNRLLAVAAAPKTP